MTTSDQCTCGASRFAGAAHMEDCYLMLGQGGQPPVINPPDPFAAADPPPASPPAAAAPPAASGPRQVDAPFPDGGDFESSIRLDFYPGLPTPYISKYDEDGGITNLACGEIHGTLLSYRDADGQFGKMWFADIRLTAPGTDWDQLRAGVLCGIRLQSLMPQIHVGTSMMIRSLPNRGRAKDFAVFVWD